jgi:hypothetical protein
MIRGTVTQIMNLLKLPIAFQEILARFDRPKEISKYSESRLHDYYSVKLPYVCCPFEKKPYCLSNRSS